MQANKEMEASNGNDRPNPSDRRHEKEPKSDEAPGSAASGSKHGACGCGCPRKRSQACLSQKSIVDNPDGGTNGSQDDYPEQLSDDATSGQGQGAPSTPATVGASASSSAFSATTVRTASPNETSSNRMSRRPSQSPVREYMTYPGPAPGGSLLNGSCVPRTMPPLPSPESC